MTFLTFKHDLDGVKANQERLFSWKVIVHVHTHNGQHALPGPLKWSVKLLQKLVGTTSSKGFLVTAQLYWNTLTSQPVVRSAGSNWDTYVGLQ